MAEIERILAEARERQAQLMAELASAPETIVSGVVDGLGANASGFSGEPGMTMRISLAAWKRLDGPIRRETLTLWRKIGDTRIRDASKGLDPYAVVAFRVRMAEPGVAGSPRALILAPLPDAERDADLVAISEELQHPVTMDDPTFGTFTLDRRLNQYEAKAKWATTPVALSICCDIGDDAFPRESLENARRLWSRQEVWTARTNDCLVERMLPLKNDAWLGEDEEPLTKETFLQRIQLESITVAGDGTFAFWYADGDVFWGHMIEAVGTLSDGMIDASLQG